MTDKVHDQHHDADNKDIDSDIDVTTADDSDINGDEDDLIETSREHLGKPYYDLYRNSNCPGVDFTMSDNGSLHLTDFNSVKITPKGDMFGTYSDLTAFLNKAHLTDRRGSEEEGAEAHHLIPKSVTSKLGIGINDGQCVALWGSLSHMSVHKFLGQEHKVSFTNADELKLHYADAYRELGFPEWSEQVEQFVEQHRATIEQHLELLHEYS